MRVAALAALWKSILVDQCPQPTIYPDSLRQLGRRCSERLEKPYQWLYPVGEIPGLPSRSTSSTLLTTDGYQSAQSLTRQAILTEYKGNDDVKRENLKHNISNIKQESIIKILIFESRGYPTTTFYTSLTIELGICHTG